MTPSNTFNCTRCRAPLAPGSMQCVNCGMTFDTPVPYTAAPGYGAPPAKKSSPIAIVAIGCAVGCLPMIGIVAAILFPVFAKARDKARETSSVSNLRQLDLGCLQYAQDHNSKLPPLDSMEHFRAAVSPYVPQQGRYDIFVEPGINEPYALNAEASNKSMENMPNPSAVVVMYETVPHSDHQIATAYADGHVALGPQE